MRQVEVSVGGREYLLSQLAVPLALDELAPGGDGWEVEIGFGKGRHLIRRAQEEPQRRFLGIEMARSYYRLTARRAERRSLSNLVLIRGEALFVISATLPIGFARAVHVYFPDPWPKVRHRRRRLFDPETVDLVLGLLSEGGHLYFATDFIDYGQLVQRILASHPATSVTSVTGAWPSGARTNYEAKYELEKREILRLQVVWEPGEVPPPLHPMGESGVVAATGQWLEEADPSK